MNAKTGRTTNFIRQIIEDDLASGKHNKIKTRFPPEPSGYLHIGHAKALCLNFGIAADYPEASCNLRFDDTNPFKEEFVYMEAMKEDIRWLGYAWDGEVKHASDYFDSLYAMATELIKRDKAFVCSLSGEQMRNYRGTLTESGKESPDRNRSIAENLDLFARMQKGEFAEGSYTLRAKIDMAASNINMRDPVLYRILKASHPRTGDKWLIYPMYDFTHCLSDAIEGITHSLCTLEFEDHRPLYDWVIEALAYPCHPRQIEFARLNINYTLTSKRRLRQLCEEGHVDAWDDPRMPTIIGMRRRGYPPQAIRDFCERVGVTKKNTVIDMGLLEECVRDYLNEHAQRAIAVLDPLKVRIINYPHSGEELSSPLHPQRPELGTRVLQFGAELLVDRSDFMEDPPRDFFRLGPGREVRLRNAYIIKCEKLIRDATGKVVELHCSYDPKTLGKKPEGRKVKGIIHWLEAKSAVPAVVRLYDRLFAVPEPQQLEKSSASLASALNPHSLIVCEHARVEPRLREASSEARFQFERLGYFSIDPDSRADRLLINRTVSLKDAWQKKLGASAPKK